MTLLLAWKVELRKFAGGVSMGATRRCASRLDRPRHLSGLAKPIHRSLGTGEPRQAWVSVVVIASIAFVNYVLLRLTARGGCTGLPFSADW